ncbi:MAG: hypothetical protein AAF226_15960 [Verrucomicrobiota bacterium]
MKNDPIIRYRGATARLSELNETRVSQLEQQQGSRLVSYRGATGEVAITASKKKQATQVRYRGAIAEIEL